eukprot:CAMPEP_0185760586 /NCGR_PEP_ID=MMETSP1174-20130828/19486_1 /TAXON_ID=35687 /ORGANISM="Dictyocha speculum, Strain CCMP1381" /LENGTH=45 /DNA_ID= /DNA_START= /DNA_END= /DNA_ORIENTATION=
MKEKARADEARAEAERRRFDPSGGIGAGGAASSSQTAAARSGALE